MLRALTFALVLAPGVARAAPSNDASACVDAADAGQNARDGGRFHEARRQLALCARDACPAIIRKDCSRWLDDVNERMPAVLFRALGPDGRDLADVRVLVDGRPLLDSLDGRYLDVDPGLHVIRFEHAGSSAREERVVVRERDRTAVVAVTFDAPPAPPPVIPREEPARSVERESKGPPALSYLLAGVGVVGVGGFAFFGLKTNHGIDDLHRTCAPGCTDAEVSPVRRDMVLANVSLGVGLVAFAASAIVWIASR